MTIQAKKHSAIQRNVNKTNISARTSLYILAAITGFTILVFSQSFSSEFVSLDDTKYITTNPYIKSLSFASILDIFSTSYNANYHPFTTLLFAVEYALFEMNAAPYHVISLLLHLANICLVFVMLKNLAQHREIAVIGSLLFAIHPLHVESVAWLSEQKDLLYSFFLLAGLIVYIKHVKENSIKDLTLVFILFLCSMLSKSAAIIFPLMMLVIDYFLQRQRTSKVLLEKIPFFLLSIVFAVVTILSQQSAGAIATEMIPPYSLGERFFVVSYALVYYVVSLFIPVNLCAMHYAPKELSWYYYAAPLVIALIIAAAWKARRMQRELIFGLIFYVFAIILVVQIIPVGYAVVAERYSYISYIGLFFIIGVFYTQVMEGEIAIFLRRSLNYILATIILIFAGVSFKRIAVWQDSITLFSDVVKKYPNEAAGHFSLGKVEADAGQTAKAFASYNRSLELKPDYADVYYSRGNLYYQEKKQEQALKDYLKALELRPDYVAVAYNAGIIYSKMGETEKAILYYSKAIDVKPDAHVYHERANSYMTLKQYSEAANDYVKEIKLGSTLPDTYLNLGVSYYFMQRLPEACAEWKRAAEIGSEKGKEYLQQYCK